jgi:hypothetical protein
VLHPQSTSFSLPPPLKISSIAVFRSSSLHPLYPIFHWHRLRIII